MTARIAFGIDLAGFVAAKSVCAAAIASGNEAHVTILRDCPFSKRRESAEELVAIVQEEVDFLRKLLTIGPVAVDIPIDLQGLPDQTKATLVWQLTLRPIDRMLGALPALADKIGAPTARFQNVIKAGKLRPKLGQRLFETYPAGSLKQLKLVHQRYRGQTPTAVRNRRTLLRSLKIEPRTLSDDELDATLCAVTALAKPAERLERKELGSLLRDEFPTLRPQPPTGYVLLQSNPYSRIRVTRRSATDWLKEQT